MKMRKIQQITLDVEKSYVRDYQENLMMRKMQEKEKKKVYKFKLTLD